MAGNHIRPAFLLVLGNRDVEDAVQGVDEPLMLPPRLTSITGYVW